MNTKPSATHTANANRSLIIYYGIELPFRDLCRKLRDVTVVLQPYHPICISNEYAEYFPYAQRFVYYNPTGVDSRLLTNSPAKVEILDHDTTWNLERLNLRRMSARRFAIRVGEAALSIGGVHGLFVDDLDRWDRPGSRHFIYSILNQLALSRSCQTAWFVNRGFGFWKHLPNIAATLLEEISPYQLDHLGPNELAWVNAIVMPAICRAHARGTEIYCLTYDPSAVGWCPYGATASYIAELAGEPLLVQRHLDRWPDTLTEGTD